ncbi:MAG: inorganic pyrophosphatase [Proteobacteria bacterium]|nr:inorganic pyrophosphatase [Pseudomonadota bacterium]
MKQLFKSHPWHGVEIGKDSPAIVTAYIEIVPTDVFKYEVDKETGHLKIDRPQKYSNYCPTLYGFIPKTYCGEEVGKFCASEINRENINGDGDPLDICVLTEKPIQHGDILVTAVPIGGLRMIDKDEADDKIIAVLSGDSIYGTLTDISELPKKVLDSLQHYFLTYKNMPGEIPQKVEITDVFGRETAHKIIELAIKDYQKSFC